MLEERNILGFLLPAAGIPPPLAAGWPAAAAAGAARRVQAGVGVGPESGGRQIADNIVPGLVQLASYWGIPDSFYGSLESFVIRASSKMTLLKL